MQFISNASQRIENLKFAPFLLAAGIAAISGSILLLTIAYFFVSAFGLPHPEGYDVERILFGPAPVFYLVVFAPVTETFLLAGLLKLLASAHLGPWQACAVSALLWGALHGISGPLRFFGSVWSFYVFGGGYLLWRRRSFQHAFAAACVPHMIVNSSVFLVARLAGGG